MWWFGVCVGRRRGVKVCNGPKGVYEKRQSEVERGKRSWVIAIGYRLGVTQDGDRFENDLN